VRNRRWLGGPLLRHSRRPPRHYRRIGPRPPHAGRQLLQRDQDAGARCPRQGEQGDRHPQRAGAGSHLPQSDDESQHLGQHPVREGQSRTQYHLVAQHQLHRCNDGRQFDTSSALLATDHLFMAHHRGRAVRRLLGGQRPVGPLRGAVAHRTGSLLRVRRIDGAGCGRQQDHGHVDLAPSPPKHPSRPLHSPRVGLCLR